MVYKLGTEVDDLVVYLFHGADFKTEVENIEDDWDPDTSVELRFTRDGTVWAAEVEANIAYFSVDSALVATRNNKEPVLLWVTIGDYEAPWAAGVVNKRGN